MAVIASRLINMDKDLVNYILNKKFDVGGITWSCKQVTYVHGDNVIRMGLVNFKLEALTLNFALEQLQSCRDFDSLIIQEIKRRYVGTVNIETCSLNLADVTSLSMSLSATTAAPTVITNTNTNTQKEENKMDAKTLAYVAANMDKVTDLIDKWGTDTTWETNAVIMLDYTYAKDVVIKKNKVVTVDGEEVRVYTATVFKAKNGKWYSSLQNDKLHGVELGDVINFFENTVTVIKAAAFTYDDGTVFISKGK